MTTGIKNWSTTASDNDSSPPNGAPEGMAPASVNDVMRQIMAEVREWYEDPTWIDFGHVPTQTGGSTFTIATNVTSIYAVGRRIRMIGTTPFELYGTISNSSYSAPNTTVTVTLDSGSLDSTLSEVAINSASIGTSGLALLAADNSFTGKIRFPDDGELTISSGAVTVTGVYHTVDTESDAATDNLDTINGGSDGQILILQTENSSRDVILTTSGNIVSPNGNVTLASTSDSVTLVYSGALSKWVIQSASVVDPFISSMTDRVLNGLKLSNNVSDATNDIDIAAGACVSDDGTTVMSLSAITKQLDAAWAVGTNQGGLDTGSIANTTYHVWVINRPDTNVTDVLFSASASAPTMPANYTKKKCIGSIIRTGGAIKAFTQYGNYFEWTSPVVDVDAANPGTSATTRTLNSIPTGVKVRAHIFAGIYGGTTNTIVGYISSLDQTDLAPQATSTAALTGMGNFHGPDAGARWSFTPIDVWTNTSAQVRTRIDASGAADRIGLISAGWMDPRI